MADPRACLDQIDETYRRLDRQWAETSDKWRDSVQREFARRYWEPLQGEHSAVTRSAAQLVGMLTQVRRTIH